MVSSKYAKYMKLSCIIFINYFSNSRLCRFEMDPQTGDKFHILQMCSNIFSQSITVLDKNWDVDHAIILDDNNGLFISHPDILVSPTRIAESCSCIRRSVLSDRVRSFGGYSYAATLGNLKHMFLEVMKFVGPLNFITINALLIYI